MKTYCFALDLKNDPELIDAYLEHHRNVWPEIIDSITGAGVIDMDIYHVGDRLFMIMKTHDDFDLQEKARDDLNNPKVRQWEELMDRFQQRLPFAKEDEKWVRMDRIFSLGQTQDN